MATSRRVDVVTLRRRDVTELLTSAMLTRRRDLVTSRRHHVATWQPLLALLCLAPQKLLLITALFTPLYLQPHQTQNQGSSQKNYEIPIKQNVKMKNRRECKMGVLGTHHTPKLSFLLVLKQELTLDRTHTPDIM